MSWFVFQTTREIEHQFFIQFFWGGDGRTVILHVQDCQTGLSEICFSESNFIKLAQV